MFRKSSKKELTFKTDSKYGFLAVFTLFNKYYIKSFQGPFFNFGFPVMILGILGSVMPIQLIFPGIIAMSAMSIGLMGMPVSILEIKQSVLLKRIGASPIKPRTFTFVIISYFTFLMVLAMLWIMMWGVIFHPTNTKFLNMFNNLATVPGFFGFLFGNLSNIILSISIGFFIATVSKNATKAQALSMMIYFPSTFLSGQFIDIQTITNSSFMNGISWMIPFRYTTMQVISSFNGQNVFDFSHAIAFHTVVPFKHIVSHKVQLGELLPPYSGIKTIPDLAAKMSTKPFAPLMINKVIYLKHELLVAMLYPTILSAALIHISIKKFSWSSSR